LIVIFGLSIIDFCFVDIIWFSKDIF
jgi:hypothetical protein